jgi:serine/threonine protein kinase
VVGTPGYVAPEVILGRGHGVAADHWSLGILINELVTGENPFYFEGMDQLALYTSICEDDYPALPAELGDEVKDLVEQLLKKDPACRLGSMAGGERGVMEHLWFDKVDQSAALNFESSRDSILRGVSLNHEARFRLSRYHYRHRLISAPWVPHIKDDPLDTSFFDDWSSLSDRLSQKFPLLDAADAAVFEDF